MPNNTINWGQAAATNSNGFGAAAGNNTIDWGRVHAITYGHDETNLVGAGAADFYTAAVVADGGTIDSKACVKSTFDALAAITISMFTEASNYQTAVLAESGTPIAGNFSCIRGTFTELNNVTT